MEQKSIPRFYGLRVYLILDHAVFFPGISIYRIYHIPECTPGSLRTAAELNRSQPAWIQSAHLWILIAELKMEEIDTMMNLAYPGRN